MIPPGPTFTWRNHCLAYHDAAYNTTIENERAVEIPIARAWLAEQPEGPVLEVGNVLAHYGCNVERTVIDRWETAGHVVAADVLAWKIGGYRSIVSISTLEHVRWDEQPVEPDGPMRAYRHLRALLAPGGRMLVTIPMGQHPGMDLAIMERDLAVDRQTTFVRAEDGSWVPSSGPRWARYGSLDRWAAAVWIGETSR